MASQPIALRVLVVDDEPLIRWAVRETLRAAGHVVEESSDASAALRAVAATPEPFHVVLLDYRLPGTTGLDLVAQIRRCSPTTGLVLITALADVEDGLAADAERAGVVAVLVKPIDMNALPEAIRAAARTALPFPRLVSPRPDPPQRRGMPMD